MPPVPKRPKPIRDKKHLAFVRTLPCLICGAYGCDAHHVRAFQLRTMGKRVGDDKTVPLCREHHDMAHGPLGEEAFWSEVALMRQLFVKTLNAAAALYRHSGDANTCERLIREWRG